MSKEDATGKMKSEIERITDESRELAVIIRNNYHREGIHFLTEGDYSQQLAYMHHPKGKTIDAHIHNHEERNIVLTQEVLVIKKGILRVDFYREDYSYLKSTLLHEGDIILLASGGHGFEVIEEVEMVEIKQGPYLGERDKTRFKGITAQEAAIQGEKLHEKNSSLPYRKA